MTTSEASLSVDVSGQDITTNESSEDCSPVSAAVPDQHQDHGSVGESLPPSTPIPGSAHEGLEESRTLDRWNVNSASTTITTSSEAKLNSGTHKSSCDHCGMFLQVKNDLATWKDKVSALERLRLSHDSNTVLKIQQEMVIIRERLAALNDENTALRDRVASLEDEAFLSRTNEAKQIARRTEALLLSQEESWSAVRQGTEISRTLTSDLFVQRSGCEEEGREVTTVGGLDSSSQGKDNMRRDDASFFNSHFVLRDTLASPARFRTGHVEIDVESNVSEPGIDDISPSQPRQIRRHKNRASEDGSHQSPHLRLNGHKPAQPASGSFEGTQSISPPQCQSPISISDAFSSDALSIQAGTPYTLKRPISESFGSDKGNRSPSRKKRSVRVPGCEPTPDHSEDSSAETRELLAAFGILEEHKKPQNHQAGSESEAQPATESVGARPQRRAAIKAGRFVKDICEQFPIIYTSPKKLVKSRGCK